MMQPALSSSHMARPSRTLAERLATEVPEEKPAAPEPTVSSMAERFAPDTQKVSIDGPRRPMLEPVPVTSLAPGETKRVRWARRGLLAVLILVALVPAAILSVLLWQGAIRLPGMEESTASSDAGAEPVSQQAAVARLPARAPVPRIPEIALTAPRNIAAKAGEEVDFTLAIDAADILPARSFIAIRGLPEGAAFSQGRPYGESEWSFGPDEIGDLRLSLAEGQGGEADLRVELMAADGTVMAGATTRLSVAPDPKAALIVRADESGRIADLMAHGKKMIEVGYLAGARAYFRRAAEAGSADAALAVGATYDPVFIETIGAQGIRADQAAAQSWYDRAKALGLEDQEAKLAALKEDWTPHAKPTPAPEPEPTEPARPAEPAPPAKATTAAAKAQSDTEGPSSGTAFSRLIAAAGALTLGQSEWVEVSNAVNVRAGPSATDDTNKVAQKGTKLRVIGRQGNWVQVANPTTNEEGWIYSRFVKPAEAPPR